MVARQQSVQDNSHTLANTGSDGFLAIKHFSMLAKYMGYLYKINLENETFHVFFTAIPKYECEMITFDSLMTFEKET